MHIYCVCDLGLIPQLELSSWPARYLLVRKMNQVNLLKRFWYAAIYQQPVADAEIETRSDLET